MYLKQIRTYLLIIVAVCVYGYFVYLPFRRETLNDVIVDYTRSANELKVDSPLYGSTLNDLLTQNLKLRGLFYNQFRDATDPTDQTYYVQAQSYTHQLQLDLLLLLLNHDLYKSTNGVGSGELSDSDCKKITSLIDSLKDPNESKADELQKTAYKLMRDQGANLGGIYILAHDMLLLLQMQDPINRAFYEIDLELLKNKEKQLVPVTGMYNGYVFGQINSSFINSAMDDAITTLQQAKNVPFKHDSTTPSFDVQSAYTVPSIPAEQSAAYVKMVGMDNGVQYNKYVYNLFTWDVPDGKYDISIQRDGDFPWHQTLQLDQFTGFAAGLVRSDDTVLGVLKPNILEASQKIGYSILNFAKSAQDRDAIASAWNFMQAIDDWNTNAATPVVNSYHEDIQPENVINTLKQLNDSFYSVVMGDTDSERTKEQLIMNTLPRSAWDKAFQTWPVGEQGTSSVKLDYNYIDVKAYSTDPLPTIYVTYAWVTPDMKREAWNVVYQQQNGRYVIVGIDTPSDLGQVQKLAKAFSYKTNNQIPLIKKYLTTSFESSDVLKITKLPLEIPSPNATSNRIGGGK